MTVHDELVESIFEATKPTRREHRTFLLARSASVALGGIQLALAIPDLFGAEMHGVHSNRHVAAFAIAIAVGLIYAGIRPHRATGLIPPLVALTICLIITCAIDIAHGEWPQSLDVHLISPVAAGVLWAVAHLARPKPNFGVGGPRRISR